HYFWPELQVPVQHNQSVRDAAWFALHVLGLTASRGAEHSIRRVGRRIACPPGFCETHSCVSECLGDKMNGRRLRLAGLLVGVSALYSAGVGASAAAAQQSRAANKLTIEQVVAIKHPSDPMWSPDGKHIAFVWDQGGIGNLYLANAGGSGAPLALTS